MPTLKAIKELRYGGRMIKPEETFEASDKDAKALKAIKKAEDADTPAANKSDLPVEVMKPKVEEAPEEPEAPLRYLRRDMRATDGPTGEETSAPSSRRGRQPRKQTSDD